MQGLAMSHPHLQEAHMYFPTNKDEEELAGIWAVYFHLLTVKILARLEESLIWIESELLSISTAMI